MRLRMVYGGWRIEKDGGNEEGIKGIERGGGERTISTWREREELESRFRFGPRIPLYLCTRSYTCDERDDKGPELSSIA